MVFQNSSRVSENKKPVVMIIINACDKRPSLDWWSWLGLTIWLSLLIDNWLDEGGLKGSIRWIYKINVFLRTQNSFYTSKRWASRSYSHLQNSVPVRTFYIKVYKFICSMFATSPAPTPPVIREGFLHKRVFVLSFQSRSVPLYVKTYAGRIFTEFWIFPDFWAPSYQQRLYQDTEKQNFIKISNIKNSDLIWTFFI